MEEPDWIDDADVKNDADCQSESTDNELSID